MKHQAMVTCQHCQTLNTLDSMFCKHCGTGFTEALVQEARSKVDTLVAEGNRAFQASRIEEALAIADTALESYPSCSPAHSLRVLCLEREGRTAEALEAAEKVVELNPDSELDRIKRNQLRRQLEGRGTVSTPGRGLIFGTATAVALLVIGLGSALAFLTRKGGLSKTEAKNNKPLNVASNTNPVSPGVVQTNPPPITPNPNAGTAGTSSTGPVTDPRTQPGPGVRNPLPTYTGTLPSTGRGDGSVTPVFPPVGGGNLNVEPNVKPPEKPIEKPTTQPAPPDVDPGPRPEKAAERNNGIVEINVSNRTEGKVGGTPSGTTPSGTTPVGGNGVRSLIATASQQFQAQNYAGAASSWESALANGADPVSVCERLGYAYDRIGRPADAARAFGRGLAAVEASLNSGKGDKTRLTSLAERLRLAKKKAEGG